jgi:hypothetical protein
MMNLLRQYRDVTSTLDDREFCDAHEAFIRALVSLERDPLEGVNSDQRHECAAFFSQCQRRYLAIREAEANRDLLAAANGAASAIIEKLKKGFATEAYERVSGLAQLIDFTICRHAVVVGSGAFPATLFWLRDHCPQMRVTGLDIDPNCVAMATALTEALGLRNIRFEALDGRKYDFADSDFVFVANQVVGKKTVLQRVSDSGSAAQIVVREPTPRGELLAESVRYDLPSGFGWGQEGIANSAFLSYDLLLRRL